MEYKIYNAGSYNIHTIKTDKFKTIKLDIILRNNFDPKNSELRSLLFDILSESTKKYDTKRKLALKYESLYNAVSNIDTMLLGQMILTDISIEFINPKYTKEDFLEEAIKMPFSLLFEPNINNYEFDAKTILLCKKRLIEKIDSIKENPSRYAILQALKKMDPTSLTSRPILENKDTINNATNESLLKLYEEVLKHDYVDIFIIGDFDNNKIVDLINKYAAFKTIKNHELKVYNENKTRRLPLKVKENSSNSQSQLVEVYNAVNLTDYEKKYVLPIYDMIFGSSSLESKLYKNLRTKNSLCYGLISSYQRYDNILVVATSLDKSNEEKAIKLIDKTFKEMTTSLKEEEIKRAIDLKISSLNMFIDYQGKILELYLFKYLNLADDYETMINTFMNVKKADILAVGKKIKKNTVYILTAGGEEYE